MQSDGNRPTFFGMLLQHVIVFLICVVFPGIVTMLAPASWLTFERSEESVRCTTYTCVYFVVPYRIQQVNNVTEISDRERAGGIRRERKYGRDTKKKIHVDGEGFLQIHGVDDQIAEVSVSPASLESVSKKSNDFLSSNKERSTMIFAIANWKFGGLMGGILTLFTILYVVGYTLGLLKLIYTVLKRAVFGTTRL